MGILIQLPFSQRETDGTGIAPHPIAVNILGVAGGTADKLQFTVPESLDHGPGPIGINERHPRMNQAQIFPVGSNQHHGIRQGMPSQNIHAAAQNGSMQAKLMRGMLVIEKLGVLGRHVAFTGSFSLHGLIHPDNFLGPKSWNRLLDEARS